MATPGTTKPTHIVLVTLDTLGDLVLRQPLIAALLDANCRVTLVVRHGYEEILSRLDPRVGYVATSLAPYDAPGESGESLVSGVADAIAALQPDVVVAAAYNRTWADEWILSRFSSCRTIGFNPDALAPPRVPRPPSTGRFHLPFAFDEVVDCGAGTSEVDKYKALFACIAGYDMGERQPGLSLTDADHREACDVLQELGLRPGAYAFCCPAGTANVPLKAWPPESFAKVAAHIWRAHALPVLLAGIPAEAELIDRVAQELSRAGVKTASWIGGPGTLGIALGLIAASRLYVGNDTGPMHCAGALGIPVVARFGGGHWPRFVPVWSRAFVATQQLPCFGCGWHCDLPTPACMTTIATETLTNGVDWVLSDSASERRVDTGAPIDSPQMASLLAGDRHRPKVFVVTPSFNQGRYLRETIESVLGQDYPNLEYFVADGGSTDDSLNILRSYGDRVRWTSGPDGGQAAAISSAWARSDADIVAWLNSDDTYLEGAVTTAVNHLLAHPDLSMVYGHAFHVDATGRRLRPYPSRSFNRQVLAGDCFICQPATFIRREVLNIVGYPDPRLRYCMDYDMWIRISEHFQVGSIERFLATSRLHASNKSLGERSGLIREAMAVSQKHFGFRHATWALTSASDRVSQLAERLWGLPATLRQWTIQRAAAGFSRATTALPFEDGWVGPRTILSLEATESRAVTLEIAFPAWPYLSALTIVVQHDGAVLAARRIRSAHDCSISFRLPPEAPLATQVVLEVSAAFVPNQTSLSTDSRILSLLLRRVRTDGSHQAHDLAESDRLNDLERKLGLLPKALRRGIRRVVARGRGVPVESTPHSDGWLGPRTEVVVQPDARGHVSLDGSADGWPEEAVLEISVHHAGRRLTSASVRGGRSFQLEFSVPGAPQFPTSVLLISDRSFVPYERGQSEDRRRLSFRLTGGDILPPGTALTPTPAWQETPIQVG